MAIMHWAYGESGRFVRALGRWPHHFRKQYHVTDIHHLGFYCISGCRYRQRRNEQTI